MAIVKVVKGLKPKFGNHCYLADGAVIENGERFSRLTSAGKLKKWAEKWL